MPSTESPIYLYETLVDSLKSKTLLFRRFWAVLSNAFLQFLVESGANAIAGRVSEPWDVVSDFSFAEKWSFVHRGQLSYGDIR